MVLNKKVCLKTLAVSLLNIGLLLGLIFVGSISICKIRDVRSQAGVVIPNDSVVYAVKVTSLNVTKDVDSVTFDGNADIKTYFVANDQEVVAGADVQLSIPTLNYQNVMTESAPGEYSLTLGEQVVITPQIPGATLADVERWGLEPRSYSFNLGDLSKSTDSALSVPIPISAVERGFEALLGHLPIVGYLGNANIAAKVGSSQTYTVDFAINIQAKLTDQDGLPVSNQTLSAIIDIPGHNYSETVSITTDADGIFTYARQEPAILNIGGGSLTVLAEPLNIDGASFVTAQAWWPPPPPPPSGEGEPNYSNQEDGGQPASANAVAQDPINVATGNVYTSAQDLSFPSRGMPVQFVRFYNSQVDYQGPLGFGWTHSYNVYLEELSNGNVRKRNGQGQLTTYVRQPDGSYMPPTGDYSTLTKNPDATFTLKEKHGNSFRFNSEGKLTSMTDRNGNTAQFIDSSGHLTKIVDTGGRETVLEYDTQGRIISITDPLGRSTGYSYDSDNNLVSMTDPLGNETVYDYNQHHCLKQITYPQRQTFEGNTVQGNAYFDYDTEGRAKEFRYDENQYKLILEYGSGRTVATDSNGNKKYYYFQDISGHKLVTRITDSQGYSREFSYDSNLNKTRSVDENGHVTAMTYDERGNLLTITDPMSGMTKFTYEPVFNMVTALTDPLPRTTSYGYDASGNLTEVTDALNQTTYYEYDGNGDLLAAIDARGGRTKYAYDTYGNLTSVTDPLSNTTEFQYDLVGNTKKIVNGCPACTGQETNFSYDDMNRVSQMTYMDGTTISYAYDEAGNRVSMTDQKGNLTNYGYDGLNRVVAVRDALGGLTRYTHDTEGNRIRTTDANRDQTTYNYDSLNRLVEVINPLGHTKRYAYDPAGNRVKLTDANGNTVRYAYDANNRLTQIVYPDATAVTFVYDASGNRVSMMDILGTTEYLYDELNRLIKVDGVETNDIITYSYDANGNRVSMTDQDGGVTTYEYDALNRLVKMTDPKGEATTYSYDQQSQLTQMVYPNHTETRYTFDHLNRLIELTNERTQQLEKDNIRNEHINSSYSYDYDAGGMRTKVTLQNGDTIEYTYDALNRLVSEIKRKSAPSERIIYSYQYTYDAVGNRLTMTRYLARDYFAVYAQNEHRPDGDIYLMPGKSYFTYKYDADNRLTAIDIRQEKTTPPQAKSGTAAAPTGKGRHKAGEMLVKFKAGTAQKAVDQLNAKYGTTVAKMIPQIGVYKLKIPEGISVETVVEQYRQEMDVQYAEPNSLLHEVAIIPNDSGFTAQWGLHNTGQTGGKPDADIDAPEAWDVTTGRASTVIAVIDSGVDFNHPDLQGKFIAGHDFVNDDSDPQDDRGHGTYVVGILGAVTNNAAGGAGVLWQSQIMPLKALDSEGSGTYEDVVSAIIYAADNGADVINMSLGGADPSDTLYDAMEYAHTNGVVMVSAAGNENGPVLYPAKYTEFGIAVAATDHNDQRAAFSNFGQEIDVAAPGVNIYSAWWDDTYTTASGTSAAAPFVSGVAGLLLSQDPALLPEEVEAKIKSTAEDVNGLTHPGEDVYLGTGRINAYAALIQPAVVPEEVSAAISYEYDKNGNQIRKTINHNGIEKMTAYEYDYENRLSRIIYPDLAASEYRYDGGGRRIESVEDNKITKFLYDGLNAVIERDWNNTTQARYTRGIGYGGGIGSIISEERRAGEGQGNNTISRYYHYDGIGTVTGLSNSLGYLMESFSYDAFGNLLGVRDELKDAVTEGYRFSTKELNAKSGLVYFGARYYDPKIGRFITPDPLTWGPDDPRMLERSGHISKVVNSYVAYNRGILDVHPLKLEEILLETKKIAILTYGALYPNLFLHRYVYCANNPVNLIDPYGNSILIEIFGVVLIFVGAAGVVWFFIQIILKSWGETITLPFIGEGLFEALAGIVYTLLKFLYKFLT